MQNRTWAVVLAGGDGKRLAALTTDAEGRHVPKQYCSLHGGPSLFELALRRARSLVAEDRLCAVVAKEHEHWWQQQPNLLPPGNLIVQPRNRGTGNGVLLALSTLLKRDPHAQLIFLPADHHVLAEETLADVMQSMLNRMPPRTRDIFLLGIEPDDADPELGYIIPQTTISHGAQGVRHFVEKPSRGVAGKLIQEGGLWNSGIFAAAGDRLHELLRARFPDNAEAIDAAVAKTVDPAIPARALTHVYERVSDIDFSHHLLQLHVADLQVVAVPQCGWSDLGTPRRVGDRVALLSNAMRDHRVSRAAPPFLDLAETLAADEPEAMSA